MPKQIEFEGQVHEFPDNFTDVDISTALSSHSESAPKKQSWPAWGMEQAGGLVQGTAESMNPLPAAKLAYRLGPVNLANFDPKGNNPDSTINTVRQLIGDPIVRGVANSVKSGMAGRPMDAMNDLIYGVPLIGPAIESGMEDVKAGRYGHAIGSVVGAIFGPKVLSKGIAAIPKVGLARGIQRASVDFPKIKNPEPAFLAERDAALDFQRQQGWSSNAATAEKGGKIQQAIAGWKPQVAASIAKAEAGGAPGVLLSDVVQPMIDLRNKTSASMFPENANAIDQRIGVVIDLAKGPQKIRLPGSKKVLLHGTPAYYKEVARQYIAKSTEIPPSDAQMAADRAAQTAELSQPYSLNGPRPPLSGRPFPVMEDGPPGTPVPDTTRIPLNRAQAIKENTDQWVRDNMFAETQPVGIEAAKRGEGVIRKGIATQAPDVAAPNANMHKAMVTQTAILRKFQTDSGFARDVLPFLVAGAGLEMFGHSTYAQTAIAAALIRAAAKNPALMSRLAILVDRAGTGPVSAAGKVGAPLSVVEQNRAKRAGQAEPQFPMWNP